MPQIYRPAGNVYNPQPGQYREYVPPANPMRWAMDRANWPLQPHQQQYFDQYQQQVDLGNQLRAQQQAMFAQQQQQYQEAQRRAQEEARNAAMQQRQNAPTPAPGAGPAPTPTPTPSPTPSPTPQPAPAPVNIPGLPPINTNFAPIQLPTRESQNQLMALGAQKANPLSAIQRGVGNNGIRAGSGVIMGQLAGPMQDALRSGALGAANLGLDDQLVRDQHMMRGILGLGQADIAGLKNVAERDKIGIDAQNRVTGSLADLLRALGGIFNSSNLLGGF